MIDDMLRVPRTSNPRRALRLILMMGIAATLFVVAATGLLRAAEAIVLLPALY